MEERPKRNAFNHEIFGIKTIAGDPSMAESIRETWHGILSHFQMPEAERTEFIKHAIEIAQKHTTLNDYEMRMDLLVKKYGLKAKLAPSFKERSQTVLGQVSPHLEGHVFDLGCGDGEIGKLIHHATKKPVTLADVFEHPNIKKILAPGLKFHKIAQKSIFPLHETPHDTSLLLTVLHHSEDPATLLKNVLKATKRGGKLVVIESVFGVNAKGLPSDVGKNASSFLSLTPQQQLSRTVYFDHFWNRILNYSPLKSQKFSITNNYNTPEGWRQLFAAHGLKVEREVPLGFDQPTSPEFHVMYVLRKAA